LGIELCNGEGRFLTSTMRQHWPLGTQRIDKVYYRIPLYGAAAYTVFTLVKLVFFSSGYTPSLDQIMFSVLAAVLVGYVGTVILIMVVVAALIPLSLVWRLLNSHKKDKG